MGTFSFAEGAAMFDSTPIENLFLMEYLPIAPEAYLRVYLYTRMLALHPELGDITDLAKALHMEQEAVNNALAYWEQQGLARRTSDNGPQYELLPVRGEGGSNPMEADYYTYRDFNAELQSIFAPQLIQPHQYRTANDWLNVLGYTQEAVLRLARYGKETSRVESPKPASVFKRLDKLAVAWADKGCHTLEDVERAIAEYDGVAAVARAVLERLAIYRDPTADELVSTRRWLEEWNYTQDQILEACEATTKSRAPSMGYLDAILKSRLGDRDAQWKALSEVLKELDAAQAKPTPDQLERYAALRAAGFEAETIRLAAVQCRRKKKTRLEDVEWMLARWGERGLYAHEAAEAYIRDMSQKEVRVRRLLELCGLERRPTMNDLGLYDKWRQVHSEDVIDFAAQCARGMGRPMAYMDKLLTLWAEAGATTVEAAKAQREAAQAKRAAAPRGGEAPANPALDYAQRKYTDQDYGDDFFIDLDQYGEEGEDA